MGVQDLAETIKTLCDNTPAISTKIPGGIKLSRHGSTGVYPYAVFTIFSNTRQMTFGNKSIGDSVVRFVVVADDDVAGAQAIDAIDDTFKAVQLALSSGQCLNCIPMHEPRQLPTPMGVNEAGKTLWMWEVSYTYSIRR